MADVAIGPIEAAIAEALTRPREPDPGPWIDVPEHDDNCGSRCRNVGRASVTACASHDCCGFCNDLGEATPSVPRLTDDMLGTEREIQRLEACLRYIGRNCEDPETVRDLCSRALRGKSLP